MNIDSINEYRAVARLAVMLAARCGYSPAAVKQIRIAALLHDVGKQRIDANIIDKPGKLDMLEFEVIKTHTTLGAEMMASVQGELGEKIRGVCRWHHEFWSGGGYWGIKASELPAYIPIVSICDVYAALVSADRPYKKAWQPKDALEYLEKQAGKQFDPALVRTFCSLMRGIID